MKSSALSCFALLVALELARLAIEVTACDKYENAPAMQVAQLAEIFNMLDPTALRSVVEKVKPDLIIPEVEALATSELEMLESEGWTVILTARATRLTMDREGIRRLAAEELQLPTARYIFADSGSLESNFSSSRTVAFCSAR